MNELEKKINKLRHDIHDHNHNYYILDNPTISDYDFDQKLQELINLESLHPEFYDSNSPSQRIGGGITKLFNTISNLILLLKPHAVANLRQIALKFLSDFLH